MNDKMKHRPPVLPRWLLHRMRKYQEDYLIAGDIEEAYHSIVKGKSKMYADCWYSIQAAGCLPKYFINQLIWRIVMFKNYLKIALRNIRKHKGYSFINILGLTSGMACTLLALLCVQYMLSYDSYHEKADRIHQVFVKAYLENQTVSFENAFAPLGKDLKNTFPEIEETTRIAVVGDMVLRSGEHLFVESDGGAADPNLFEFFTFQFIKGNSATALSTPNSIVLTRELAQKYFGTEDPMGKTITIENQYDFMVTAVIEDLPDNTHLEYTYFLPMEFMRELGAKLDEYDNSNYYTYLLLDENADSKTVSDKIFNTFKVPIEDLTFEAKFYLVKLTDVFLNQGQRVPKFIVMLLSVMAFLILVTACINFMNLATARSLDRAKEVGMRKVVGGTRSQLIGQFLSESVIQTVIACLLAIIVIGILLPVLRNTLHSDIAVNLSDLRLYLIFVGVLFFTGILSGSYPSFFLSSYRPIAVLSGQMKKGKKGARFRKILVVVQFFFSVALIIITVVSILQMQYLKNTYLGFETENILYTRGDKWGDMELVRNELLKNPDIMEVTTSRDYPSTISSYTPSWGLTNGINPTLAGQTSVGYDYLDLFEMELVAGRFFSREKKSDQNESIVVNERTVKHLGLEHPLNTKLYYQEKPYTIIGVVKNFHSFPLKVGVGPLVMVLKSQSDDVLFVKIKEGTAVESKKFIENVLKRFNPNYPIDIKFLDDYSFDEDNVMGMANKIMIFLTILAIFISCLGLFGLASFMSEQRTKEIGIRKTLGASVGSMMGLLTRQYIKLLVVADIIAIPLSYFIVKSVLDFFAYRIELKAWIFIATGLLVMLFALISVSYQTIRAAISDPVDSLRYE